MGIFNEFELELSNLINKIGMDTLFQMPDFKLAKIVSKDLKNMLALIVQRDIEIQLNAKGTKPKNLDDGQ